MWTYLEIFSAIKLSAHIEFWVDKIRTRISISHINKHTKNELVIYTIAGPDPDVSTDKNRKYKGYEKCGIYIEKSVSRNRIPDVLMEGYWIQVRNQK